jgi:cobalt-zinc-cadmium efflux system membrane fusion protein
VKALAILAIVGACGKGTPASESKPEEAAHEGSQRIEVSERVAKDSGIQVAAVELAALPATIDLSGEVAADPDHVAKVSVRVSGRMIELKFQEGQRVTSGQVLAVIESGEVARVRAELSSRSTRADAARRRVERLTELVKLGTASTQDLETARAEAGVLETDIAAARSTLASIGGGGGATARMELRAPLAGVVTKRDGVVGQPVSAEHVVAEIVDLDHAVFIARMFEHDLARVHEGASAEVRLAAFPDTAFAGKVVAIGRQVEPIARAVLARIAIDDRDEKLKIGLFGTVQIVIPDLVAASPGPVVPIGAVTQIDEHPTVFVEVAPRQFEVRAVELGHATGGRIEIVKGLKAAERVAVAGLFTLKSLALKSTFGEED